MTDQTVPQTPPPPARGDIALVIEPGAIRLARKCLTWLLPVLAAWLAAWLTRRGLSVASDDAVAAALAAAGLIAVPLGVAVSYWLSFAVDWAIRRGILPGRIVPAQAGEQAGGGPANSQSK